MIYIFAALLQLTSTSLFAEEIVFDSLKSVDEHFTRTEHTFDGNISPFSPQNISWDEKEQAAVITVNKSNLGYHGGELKLKDQFGDQHYGRYEIEMKTPCATGTVAGFFLFRWNPWQEVDIELVGYRPTIIQTSMVSNEGDDGQGRDEPAYRPRTFPLGFSACEGYHRYTITWSTDRIRFYVDDRLIDERRKDKDSLPRLPMRLYTNFWLHIDDRWKGPIEDSWSGPISDLALPAKVYIRRIRINESHSEKLLSRMTLDEKIDMLAGTGFATRAIPRLNIPSLEMTDGPVGVRFGEGTAWPAGIALGATFNPPLIEEMSRALGEEVRAHSKRLLLGPTVNIARTPWGGRSFESYGEDPYLAGQLVRSFVTGVQSQGVGTSVKHMAVNNQEWRRMDLDVNVSERALREIYLPAFQSAIDAGSATVMAAYNKVNGHYASENRHLILDILKNEWSFPGFVLSDWGATHSTVEAALSGLDLEMPVGTFFGADLRAAVYAGKVPLALIEDKARRILDTMDRIGLFDSADSQKPADKFEKHHPDLALKVASESLVLLKNQNHVLPLAQNSAVKVAVLGPSAAISRSGGGGSSYVWTSRGISALQGLQQRIAELNSPMQLLTAPSPILPGDQLPHPPIFSTFDGAKWVPGFKGEYFCNANLNGPATLTRIDDYVNFDWQWSSPQWDIPSDYFSVSWSARMIPRQSGVHEFVLDHDNGVRLYIDDKLVLDGWAHNPLVPPFRESRVKIQLHAGQEYNFRVEYFEDEDLANVQLGVIEPDTEDDPSIMLAKKSDSALVFVGNSVKIESEAYDRETMRLTPEQENLIKRVARVNPNTIVVIQAGSPIEMSSWINKVKGVIFAWYPGEQGGLAIADALLGMTNPSGRLPISFPKRWADSSAASSYPGQNGQAHYTDDIFVGYRHFDKHGIEPLFPFGYGLSYSKFTSEISDIKVTSARAQAPQVEVTVQVHNHGPVSGAYTIPLYVSDLEPKVEKAPKELKAFSKVYLAVNETKTVKLTLSRAAFQYYDVNNKRWQVDAGRYRLSLASPEAKLIDHRDVELK